MKEKKNGLLLTHRNYSSEFFFTHFSTLALALSLSLSPPVDVTVLLLVRIRMCFATLWYTQSTSLSSSSPTPTKPSVNDRFFFSLSCVCLFGSDRESIIIYSMLVYACVLASVVPTFVLVEKFILLQRTGHKKKSIRMGMGLKLVADCYRTN